MSLDPRQFRARVIAPVLSHLGMQSAAAETLLLGTALVESGLSALVQGHGGPALGVYQIEPATHDDIWLNFLAHRDILRRRVEDLAGGVPPGAPVTEQLVVNLAYATAIARLVYYRRPEPLPPAWDIEALGRYWKAHYNTRLGAGDPAEFVRRYTNAAT